MLPKIASPIVFICLFLGFFALQSYAYYLVRGTLVEHWLVDELTVKPSAVLLDSLLPNDNVRAKGHQLISKSTRITVLNGCEGTESIFLLIAAILAFRATWSQKILGVVVGVLFIFILNQIRIVSLFLALKSSREWFQWIHGYIGPTIIIILSCAFFLGWLNVIRSNRATV